MLENPIDYILSGVESMDLKSFGLSIDYESFAVAKSFFNEVVGDDQPELPESANFPTYPV